MTAVWQPNITSPLISQIWVSLMCGVRWRDRLAGEKSMVKWTNNQLCKKSNTIYHHIFIISQLWLTYHPRSTVVLLDTGTHGTSREIYSRMLMVRLEFASPGLQTQCSSQRAVQLKSYCWEGVGLSSWCIASLYIYHFSTLIDFSSEKYSGSTGHRNSLQRCSLHKNYHITINFLHDNLLH